MQTVTPATFLMILQLVITTAMDIAKELDRKN